MSLMSMQQEATIWSLKENRIHWYIYVTCYNLDEMFMSMKKNRLMGVSKKIESIGREVILYVFVHYRRAIINERKESSLSLEIIVGTNDHLTFYLLLPLLITSGRELTLFTNPFTNQCSTISIVLRDSML